MPAKLDEHEVLERECFDFIRKYLFVKKKQLDTATIAFKRSLDITTSGDSNYKEAQGFRILSSALQTDARLICHKSFEKALADCSVYKSGCAALGIQLKTTGVFWTNSTTGLKYFSFRQTDGYSGLLMVFIAVHTTPPRIWLADGSEVVSKGVQIPVVCQRRANKRITEVTFENIAGVIVKIYEDALANRNNYVLLDHTDYEKPTDRNALAEYNAFKRLQRDLPVEFEDPPSEHMAYDYMVFGTKWQLKLARYKKSYDCYHVNCCKNAGRIDRVQTKVQYAIDDFDYLCIQLPQDSEECCYVIPQAELHKRGLLGDSNKGDGYVKVYPHRQLTSTKKVHDGGVHWTEAYRLDFGAEITKKLQQILNGSHVMK